jgi:hypothetical protein
MAGFSVEVVLGQYACRATMGEHAVVPPLVDNKRGEPKMTLRLAALVKRVAELCTVDVRACHCVEEFTLRWIHPLGW